jgi:hypothetical protein
MKLKTTIAVLALSLASLAAAQTTYTLDAHGSCGDPNSSACYVIYQGTVPMPFVAPMPEPMFYPWVSAVFTTGLSVPHTFHTGKVHPQPAPESGTGQGTFNWGDGGGKSGVITVTLACSFGADVVGWPFYDTMCSGMDSAGNSVTFTHILFVSEGRYGYWGWFDHHGTMVLTLAN